MAVLFPDKIKSNNPVAYGIVDANEVTGIKSVSDLNELFNLPDSILKGDKTELACIGQIWNVAGELYILIDYKLRKENRGWKHFYFTDVNVVYINIENNISLINDTDTIVANFIAYDKTSKKIYAKRYGDNKFYKYWVNKHAVADNGNRPSIKNIYTGVEVKDGIYTMTLFRYNINTYSLEPIVENNEVIDKTTLDNILI
jgi:hypothetical protein|nr:MAG TPA: hypothetical protein [Crassvirales sp.]